MTRHVGTALVLYVAAIVAVGLVTGQALSWMGVR